MLFDTTPQGSTAPDAVDGEFKEEDDVEDDVEEADGAEDGDVLQELPSGSLFRTPPPPRPTPLASDQGLSFASRLFDRGNKGYLTDAESGARRIADPDGNVAPGAAVELVEGHRKLRSWAKLLAGLSGILLVALVAVGASLGNNIRSTGQTTQEKVAESQITRAVADERGDVHLVDKDSGSEFTVRSNGDTFTAQPKADARTGRELHCLPVQDTARMVHDLASGTKGSLVLPGEDGIEKKILSIDGDFEDHGSYLQFGSFQIRMDSDACDTPNDLDVDAGPAVDAAVGVEEEEEDNGIFDRRLSRRLRDGTERRGPRRIPRATRDAAFRRNRRDYAMAHEAIKEGRELFLNDIANGVEVVVNAVVDFVAEFVDCLEEEFSSVAVWGNGDVAVTIGFPNDQCDDLFSTFILDCLDPTEAKCVIIMRDQAFMDAAKANIDAQMDSVAHQASQLFTDLHESLTGAPIGDDMLSKFSYIAENNFFRDIEPLACPLEFKAELSGEAEVQLSASDEAEDNTATFNAMVTAGVVVSGQVEFELWMHKFPPPVILEQFFVKVEASIVANGHLEFEATGAGSYEEEMELAPKKVVFRKFAVVYYVPLLIEIHVQPMFFFEATAEAEGTLTIDVSAEMIAKIMVDFDLSDFDLDADVFISDPIFNPPVDVFLEGTFEASVAGRLGARFTFSVNSQSVDVDVAASLGASLSLEAAFASGGSPCVKGSIGFFGGLEGRASFENPLNPITQMANACEFATGILSSITDMTTPIEKCIAKSLDSSELEDAINDRNKFLNEICDDLIDEVESAGIFNDPCVDMILQAPTTDWMTFVGVEVKYTLAMDQCEAEVNNCPSNRGESSLDVSLKSSVGGCFSSIGLEVDGFNLLGLSGTDGGCSKAIEKFEDSLPGYCRDDQNRLYGGVYTALTNLGGTTEGCAAWCQSFRAPGFVGFMLGGNEGNYCACRYSVGTQPKRPGVLSIPQTGSGIGPIASSNDSPNVKCYKVKDYISPLDSFEDTPLQGYCKDDQNRNYGSVFTELVNLGETNEACAAWCLSFRAPGFVGFMLGGNEGNYCACRYSINTGPVVPKEIFNVQRQVNIGKGPIHDGSGHTGIQCYKIKNYVSPLALYENPRDGYCRDIQNRLYSAVYTKLSNLGGSAEDCAAWCLSYDVGGFVGFMLGGTSGVNYCACRYSEDTIPQVPQETFQVLTQTNTGMSPVKYGDGQAGVQCYKIKNYRIPSLALVFGAVLIKQYALVGVTIDLSQLVTGDREPPLSEVYARVQAQVLWQRINIALQLSEISV